MKTAPHGRSRAECIALASLAETMDTRNVNFIARTGRVALNPVKLIVVTSALAMTNLALAGPTVPLGTPLGVGLGGVLGNVLGSILPIASGGLLTVAALSLALGIYIVRRKRIR